jgi:hypothetical protein
MEIFDFTTLTSLWKRLNSGIAKRRALVNTGALVVHSQSQSGVAKGKTLH